MGKACRNQNQLLPDKVLAELAAIGLTRATDVLDLENGQVGLKPPSQMGKQQGAAIASVEKTSGGLKIKFYDKLKALELLGDHFGLFSANAGREPEENNLLEAILQATGERVNTDDIPELQQAADTGDELVESAEAE